MRRKEFFLILGVLITISCAGNKPKRSTSSVVPPHSTEYYFPGVDSSVAKNALRFSKRLIVDFERRVRAKNWFQTGRNSYAVAESLLSCVNGEQRRTDRCLDLYFDWREKQPDKSQPRKLRDQDPMKICLTVLDSAQHQVARAKYCNPFDLDIRSLLIKIYLKQGELTRQPSFYLHAIDELNNFLLVDKSNPYIYEKLAECYYALEDWENCYRFFHEAEKILKIVIKFKRQTDQRQDNLLDTTRLVYYLRGQGEAKAKLYDDQQAIHYLTAARELSSSPTVKQQLQDILDWIDWDGGNIRAAEFRDKISKIEAAHDYKKARARYLELLKMLKTDRARNEINWKVASLEYQYLGKKKEALKRLFRVVQQIRNDRETNPLHTIYLKDYAAMCYSVGMEYFKQNAFRLAYIYLNQAAQFDWEHKGDCFFQLALLSRENPGETIRNCKYALEYATQLSKEKIKTIYKMLAISYKRRGEFDIADTYFENLKN